MQLDKEISSADHDLTSKEETMDDKVEEDCDGKSSDNWSQAATAVTLI